MDGSDFEARQARRLRRGRQRAADAAVATVLVGADVLVAGNMLQGRPGFVPWFPVSCLVAVALGAIFAVRRRWPRHALRAAVTVSAVAAAAGALWDPFAATALALYPVAAVSPPRRSARALGWCLAIAAGGVWAAQVVHPRYDLPVAVGWTLAAWLLLAVSWLVGTLVRARRLEADARREQEARQIVADERLRIARELHDVVTHGMGLIAVKAGIANHIADERPEEARDALRVIESTSRGALSDMRRLLDVLREDTGPGTELTQPGIAGLRDLAEDVEAAGVQAELAITGDADLPEALQLAVYRIVQEALTNVAKHAAPARCTVTVAMEPGRVDVQVVDDGSARPAPSLDSGGHGLVGMRERVAMYGGTFSAGPRPEGGFAVSATLPWTGRADGG